LLHSDLLFYIAIPYNCYHNNKNCLITILGIAN
jgi:hypothetical protein